MISRRMITPSHSPSPHRTTPIRIDLDLADGRSLQKLATYDPESWQAATDAADVRIGENRFSGDLHTYRIEATIEEIAIDATLRARDLSPAAVAAAGPRVGLSSARGLRTQPE
jgi:hypothetical protein